MNNQNEMPLVEALKKYSQSEPAYFCIPGHRFGRGISSELISENDREFLRFDLTEVTGLDDLHQPSGVIQKAQELMAQLFRVRKSFFLVNGTTCGNEAMVLSGVKEGDKIIVPRNVHKSVLSGLILSGATPIFVMPEWISEWNIWGGLSPVKVRELLNEQPDIKGVLMASPSYYGIVDKVEEISRICHEFDCLCMVDEAHGAHLYFSDELPKGALELGADICVQSFHKVTGALTQSSVMHVMSEKMDEAILQNNLQMLQSSSPSYLLMASLDAARYELAMQGQQMCNTALELARYARDKIDKVVGVSCLPKTMVGKCEISDIDLTKLVITAVDIGLSGFELKDMLMHDYNVEVELADHHNILAVLTFANTKTEVTKLVEALADIAQNVRRAKSNNIKVGQGNSGVVTQAGNTNMIKGEDEFTNRNDKGVETLLTKPGVPPLPKRRLTPRVAHFGMKRKIPWQDAIGKVAGEAIIPYPPGIPVVYPGEVINQEIWNYVEKYREIGCLFHGVSDEKLTMFEIVDIEE